MINVYIADLTGLENKYDEKLNKLHKSRADKLISYKMSADKVRALGAGLLLEKGLVDYLETADRSDSITDEEVCIRNIDVCEIPRDQAGRYIIEYVYGPQGKPYLKDFPNVHFSLSHSGKYVVLAIADEEIGIDVQEFRGFNEKIAKRFYHEKEIEILEAVSNPVEKEILFYKIWTCKEGYIKYTGKGMRQDLSSFYYDAELGKVCDGAKILANCQTICIQNAGYFCSLVFHKNIKKIDKIIKLSL